ncbi:hypothetical protein E1293_41545 [Actinomadura darangshiensis]|uniref:ABM domain-containing protein n=1 Tax=Actinomadura darangshiensis TaxID=705336 RepID=A0A4R5A0J3_9ACTN|nr:hypothetical protein [Actinomadura darangshiensis]TDD64390.1 hypothetical protein E1293_41545 [Actinomadura darangshiensis]
MQVMIRSKVRPEHVERSLVLLREVYAELEKVRPEGLRYASYQLDDKVTFVAFAEMDGPEVLRPLPAFQRYRAALDDCCDEPPQLTMLDEVGSYGFR